MKDDFVINSKNMKRISKGNGPFIIVDDDHSQISIVKACYEMSGRKNELICITSGDGFLKYMDSIKLNESEFPVLVLLDINMPKTSGFDVLAEIRKKEVFKDIPIIVMFSTSDFEADLEKSFKLNANAFFPKPMQINDYVHFFKNI